MNFPFGKAKPQNKYIFIVEVALLLILFFTKIIFSVIPDVKEKISTNEPVEVSSATSTSVSETNNPSNKYEALVISILSGNSFEIERQTQTGTIRKKVFIAGTFIPKINTSTEIEKPSIYYITSNLLRNTVIIEEDQGVYDENQLQGVYVFMNNTFFNETFIALGNGLFDDSLSSQIKYKTLLDEAQTYAQNNNLGLWNITLEPTY